VHKYVHDHFFIVDTKTLSSSGICRLSAVGLGWDRAFGATGDMGVIDEQRKRWVEIDNRDAITPVWEAFKLF